MTLSWEVIQKILARYNCSFEYGSLEACGFYGEPDYTNPKCLILFANWNNVPNYVISSLERNGYSLEYQNAWIIDDETSKCYRTIADHMYWTPSYYITENGTVFGKDDWSETERIKYFKNNPYESEPWDLDLNDYGWQKLEIENTWQFKNDFFKRDELINHLNNHGLDVIFQYSDRNIYIWIKGEEDGTDQQD